MMVLTLQVEDDHFTGSEEGSGTEVGTRHHQHCVGRVKLREARKFPVKFTFEFGLEYHSRRVLGGPYLSVMLIILIII